jgi:hypothetical protein
MSYFLKLNLKSNPVSKNPIFDLSTPIVSGYKILRPDFVLSNEIMEEFKSMGLKTKFVVLFGRNDTSSSTDDRMIHADVCRTDEGIWKKLLFGINWEITGSYNEFFWWDMSAVPEIWPEEDTPKAILNGIHYKSRGFLGIPDKAVKLDQAIIDGPTLVRTDVPHSTVYTNNGRNRLGLSVRFDESGFENWEQVLEKFRPYELHDN